MYLMLLGLLCFVSFGGTSSAKDSCDDPVRELFSVIDSEIVKDDTFTYSELLQFAEKLGSSDTLSEERLLVSLEKLRTGFATFATYLIEYLNTKKETLEFFFMYNYDNNDDGYIDFLEFEYDYNIWKGRRMFYQRFRNLCNSTSNSGRIPCYNG